MPNDALEPDEIAREQAAREQARKAWEALPRNTPSRDALPPLMGGSRALWGWMIATGIIIILAILFGRGL